MRALELSGARFGRWTVLSRAENLNECSSWNCVCDCRTKRVVRGSWLNKGKSLSCGCLAAELSGARNATHRMRMTKEYKSWDSIKQRCLNERHKSYADYGGRGITICQRWLDSFEAFFADVGPAPTRRNSIERRDVNGNYEPSNCVWALPREQARNKRNNTRLTAFGETKLLCEWAEDARCVVTPSAFDKRISADWPVELALVTPKYATRRGPRTVRIGAVMECRP